MSSRSPEKNDGSRTVPSRKLSSARRRGRSSKNVLEMIRDNDTGSSRVKSGVSLGENEG